MAGNENKDIDQIAEGSSQSESSEQTARDSDEQSESEDEIVEEEEEEKEAKEEAEEDMITTLANFIGIDLTKHPQDPTLGAEFQKIMAEGAERLAEDFRKNGTPTEGGYWCAKEALDVIGKTCDDVKEQLKKIVGFATLMRDDVEAEADEDCEMVE